MMTTLPCISIMHRSSSSTDLAGGATALTPDAVDLDKLSLEDLSKMLEERKLLLASMSKCSPPSSPRIICGGSLPCTSLSFDSGCETGVDSAIAAMLYTAPSAEDGPRKLTPEERAAKIERYRAKRKARNFDRPISYQCRKKVADNRPRVRGRFARDNAEGAVYPSPDGDASAPRRKRSKAELEADKEAALLASVLNDEPQDE